MVGCYQNADRLVGLGKWGTRHTNATANKDSISKDRIFFGANASRDLLKEWIEPNYLYNPYTNSSNFELREVVYLRIRQRKVSQCWHLILTAFNKYDVYNRPVGFRNRISSGKIRRWEMKMMGFEQYSRRKILSWIQKLTWKLERVEEESTWEE